MWFWGHMPGIIIVLHLICIVIVIFVERKSPVQTIAWLLALFFLPVVGMILYIFLGAGGGFALDRRFRKKQQLDAYYDGIIKEQLHLMEEDGVQFKDPRMQYNRDMVIMNLKENNSVYSADNAVDVFVSAREKYDALIEDIRNARESIHIMYFIWKPDDIGQKLVDLLAQKAAEGVEVRVMYDSFGVILYSWQQKKMFKRITAAGGRVQKFLNTPIINLLRVNYRNHRKIVVIDGEIGYTGGMNIGREYMGMHKRITPWRDTHIRVRGSCVASLQMRFLMDWWYLEDEPVDSAVISRYFKEACHPGTVGMQMVSSGPDSPKEEIKYAYLKMINSAKQTLYIQTPYLIPDQSVAEALKVAAASGVDVRIMIPGVPDKRMVYRATLSYAEELTRAGVKLYRYEGFIHAKMLVADDLITSIGTTNLDHRSFALNFEINAFLYDCAFARKCKQIFYDDLTHCQLLTPELFDKRSLPERMVESVMRILSPLF